MRLHPRLLLCLSLTCVLTAGRPAGAQQRGDDPVETARIQIGPLGVTPAIAVSNIGIDSNVFRSEERPERDVTFTVSPGATAWLRAGRTRLTLEGRSDMVYFQRYASERSLDGTIGGRYEIRANRLTPWVAGQWTSGRQRVGYEIDARSRRVERQTGAGVDLRLRPNTDITLSVQRTDHAYDADAMFLGTSLYEVLNRRGESMAIGLSQRLTSLTTFKLEGQQIRDRFVHAPARDADAARLLAGFDLEPFALISGSVRVGYQRFDLRDNVPDYTGLVAWADAAYTLLGRTRFDVVGQREINYSFDVASPYYVLTGGQLTVTPRLSSHWDLQGRIGRHQLDYRAAHGGSGRVEHHLLHGGGIGYRLGASVRVAFDVDREQRASGVPGREYRGYKMGVSMTYGR